MANRVTKTAAAAGIAAALTTGGAAVYKTYYIDADGGGRIDQYVAKYYDAYKRGDKIIIRGNCYSSCTVALGFPNTCMTEKAVMGFHPGYVPYLWLGGLFHYYISPEGTAEMRRHYPPDALAVIDKYHGLDDKGGWWRPEITTIKATEFPKRYLCDNHEAA